VREWIKIERAEKHDLTNPFEIGQTYLVRVEGRWVLPNDVYGYANAKSSTGRLGFCVGPVADGVGNV